MPDLTARFNNKHKLLSDKDVASLCGMSHAWVRAERFKRKRGEHHNLTVDPVMIGKSPRYRAEEIFEWIEGLSK